MANEPLLMIPGPVMLHPRVLKAMSKQMINHRDKAFSEIYDECRSTLQYVLNTKNDTYVLTGSGSCAMEAAVSNLVKGDRVVSIVNGKFGERFRDIALRYGTVESLEFEWGTPIDLKKVEDALAKGAKVVTMVHNETSAGVKNPAEEVGRLARKYDALFVLDCITSAGGDLVEVDRWGVDIAVTGAQKCLGAPSGLSSVSVSRKAWDSMVKNPPYYMDLKKYKKSAEAERSETPYTPSITLFYGMLEAMRIIREETMEKRIARHRKGAEGVRAAMKALGLELYPVTDEHTVLSNTVTAVKLPGGVTDKDLRGTMKSDDGVAIAGGQDRLKGRIFRIPTMNAFTEADMARTLGSLENALIKLNALDKGKKNAGVEAFRKVFNG
ncbi:L-aspartate aminotransferase apoenzyme / phosphoserine aminotransferase apoenzyme [Methanocella conradii HZ254]|uniref:L-aspartate aminotransferase apoenzyme / phosphoserine aminotransferase apoenzyme n=1 Tax=Methanocella conradii (strain DSM 24694 / JCM 17849 / CGMCC 1.5162 / HZ254) TaxID=1041930 RepID=H8IAL3_METCZ|nr:alanine--glyoxylate aminotransferase family protein [Methanocella conradii]AFD00110.1 L-aspartate aminotransferase apoenzyme / phosphoserine aminotransferase apoenzyme [Methanocella conradii HZ254]